MYELLCCRGRFFSLIVIERKPKKALLIIFLSKEKAGDGKNFSNNESNKAGKKNGPNNNNTNEIPQRRKQRAHLRAESLLRMHLAFFGSYLL